MERLNQERKKSFILRFLEGIGHIMMGNQDQPADGYASAVTVEDGDDQATLDNEYKAGHNTW